MIRDEFATDASKFRRLKARLRPTRGRKRDHWARVIVRGHALMQISGAVLGSLGIGSAALAVGNGPNGTGPPGHTGIYTPCPHTGYTSRSCGHGAGLK